MSHLLLLYVTLEQEMAISQLFEQKNWALITTDLATVQAQNTLNTPQDSANQEGQFNNSGNCPNICVVENSLQRDERSVNENINSLEGDVSSNDHHEAIYSMDTTSTTENTSSRHDSVENIPTCSHFVLTNAEICNTQTNNEVVYHTGEISLSNADSIGKLTFYEDLNDRVKEDETMADKATETSIDNAVDDENNVPEEKDSKQKQTSRKIIQMKIERGKQLFLEKKKKQQKERELGMNGKRLDNGDTVVTTERDKRSNKTPTYCHDCKTMFTSQKRFEAHKLKNGGRCVFECEYCGKVFLYRYSKYLLHLKSAHTKERPFVCDICNKAYITSDKLKIHKRQHTGEKPCVCEQCGRLFYSRSDLSTHIHYHHTAKENLDNIVCDKCNITFSSKRYLIYHKNVTHSNRRDFVCIKCDKGFKSNSALQRHLKYFHSEIRDYKCSMCEKAFKTSATLRKHLLRHGGEKEFYCSYCEKSFYENSKLVQHVRIHTGEKPYRCDLCDYRCALSGNLSKHRKTHYKTL